MIWHFCILCIFITIKIKENISSFSRNGKQTSPLTAHYLDGHKEKRHQIFQPIGCKKIFLLFSLWILRLSTKWGSVYFNSRILTENLINYFCNISRVFFSWRVTENPPLNAFSVVLENNQIVSILLHGLSGSSWDIFSFSLYVNNILFAIS